MSEDDWEPNELRVDALDRIRRGDTSGWFDLCAAEHALGRSRPAGRAATRAASAGDPQGWFVTAQIAWSRGNVRRARARLTRADHGDPMVRALDAVLRAEAGVGVSEEERTRAREWFDEADVVWSRLLVAQGQSERAVEVLQEATRRGSRLSATSLGYLLEESGRGVEAKAAYRIAIEQGGGYAAYNLALMHAADGEMAAARHWARVAADRGDRRARRWLSSLQRQVRRARRGATSRSLVELRVRATPGLSCARRFLGNYRWASQTVRSGPIPHMEVGPWLVVMGDQAASR